MSNQKGTAHILLILILLVGIIAGVFLVGKTQIFKPKAASSSIQFIDNECTKVEGQKKILTCPTVKFDLVSPLEINESSDASFELVKTAYAAGSGGDYYCKDVDPNKIYHKVCELPLAFLCNLPWWKNLYRDEPEPCGIGQECQSITEGGVFNKGAQCGAASNEPTRNIQAPPFPTPPAQTPLSQPGSRLNSGRSLASAPSPSTIPTIPAGASTPSLAPAASSLTSQGGGQGAPTPNPAPNTGTGATAPNTGTGTTAPNTGTGNTAPNAGTGATNPAGGGTNPSPTAPARVTKKYRFADNPNFLDDKQQPVKWKTYKAGGVSETYTFKDTPGEKFIYAQFMDDQGQKIKFPSGDDFISAHIELKAPLPAAEPTASARASSSPAASSTAPTAPPAPAAEAACDLGGDIANWRNCPTKESLKATLLTLPEKTRDLLPDEAVTLYTNDVMLQLFSKKRLSSLDSKYLRNFGNGDLLAIADASGLDRKTFFSNFDCSRIGLFTQDIKDLFKDECGF